MSLCGPKVEANIAVTIKDYLLQIHCSSVKLHLIGHKAGKEGSILKLKKLSVSRAFCEALICGCLNSSKSAGYDPMFDC